MVNYTRQRKLDAIGKKKHVKDDNPLDAKKALIEQYRKKQKDTKVKEDSIKSSDDQLKVNNVDDNFKENVELLNKIEQLTKENNMLVKENKTLSNTTKSLTNKNKTLVNKNKKLSDDLTKFKDKDKRASKARKDYDSKINDLNSKISSLETELSTANNNISLKDNEISDLGVTIATLDARVKVLSKIKNDLKKANKKVTNQKSLIKSLTNRNNKLQLALHNNQGFVKANRLDTLSNLTRYKQWLDAYKYQIELEERLATYSKDYVLTNKALETIEADYEDMADRRVMNMTTLSLVKLLEVRLHNPNYYLNIETIDKVLQTYDILLGVINRNVLKNAKLNSSSTNLIRPNLENKGGLSLYGYVNIVDDNITFISLEGNKYTNIILDNDIHVKNDDVVRASVSNGAEELLKINRVYKAEEKANIKKSTPKLKPLKISKITKLPEYVEDKDLLRGKDILILSGQSSLSTRRLLNTMGANVVFEVDKVKTTEKIKQYFKSGQFDLILVDRSHSSHASVNRAKNTPDKSIILDKGVSSSEVVKTVYDYFMSRKSQGLDI